jgi:hypothetical protein
MAGQSAILSGGYSPWQAPLAALFSGISAAGQPGGWSNFGQGVTQGQQNFQQGQAQQQMMQLRQQQMVQAEEEMRRANQEREQQEALISRLRSLGSPAQVGGPGGIQTASGTPTAAMFGGDPQIAAIYNGLLDAGDTKGALGLATDFATREPAAADAPTVKDFYEGGNVVQKQWDPTTGAWVEVGRGNRWEPNAPAAAGGEFWEPYVDPVSKRTGQKNTKTGKIDWDPGSTMMVQTGTDQNGNPIFDMVSTSAGKPPSESNIQAGIRGTLIESSINNIRDIAKDLGAKISPLRMAAADTIGENGPLGAYGANVLRTDDEKKYTAAISKGVEGLVAAITGAGVAKDQFPRIQNLIPGPTDSPEIVNWKLDQLMPILDTLVAGSGPLALSKNATPNAPGGPKPPADMSDDELMKALGQ